jgi:GH24 family phage-related lysozyme (muramidase)
VSRARIIGGSAAAAALASGMGAYYEGVFPVGYADPAGIPTDCIGETGPDVRIGHQRYTFDECVRRYPPRLQRVWDDGLSRCVAQDVSLHQGAALMSWADNVGITAACSSTLVRMLNAGAEPAVWCAQLPRWDKARVLGVMVTLPGLTKRRISERTMCLGGDWRNPVVTVHWHGVEVHA